jgi:chemotaxis protein methyltransferase CheR
MQIQNFTFFRDFLKKESGLIINEDKVYLLTSRLSPVAKKWGYETIDKMGDALKTSSNKDLVRDVVEAMTTNETSFFRDTRPFDLFRDEVMPPIIEARQTSKRLRIWCAACSSGQEPYSLEMIMREEPLKSKLAGFHIEIVATDISEDILAQARQGEYTQFEVQRGLPITMLMNNFEQRGEKWGVKEDLKKNIKYKYFNLLAPMAELGKFDIIFCRNVLIYFDEATKGDVLNRMAKQLAPDGFLFLGGAETVLGITDSFKLKEGARGLYVLNNAQSAKPASASA